MLNVPFFEAPAVLARNRWLLEPGKGVSLLKPERVGVINGLLIKLFISFNGADVHSLLHGFRGREVSLFFHHAGDVGFFAVDHALTIALLGKS